MFRLRQFKLKKQGLFALAYKLVLKQGFESRTVLQIFKTFTLR
jgi:hypothetical protein